MIFILLVLITLTIATETAGSSATVPTTAMQPKTTSSTTADDPSIQGASKSVSAADPNNNTMIPSATNPKKV